ncbi:4-phosphopantetheinyl transferase family protein [Gelidibacter salicanalis]|uniref:4-phosphopantetheinyl transferase family protein n=1 Tax=Gelidibacter salicanalis TaxID=291193 RepID=A0A5C7AR45_9FLAO|nr:4'-phosphopantetheinyl transferase superfamily protein [Gelidibacter salicanalis]TXE08312.1 4-phosphopantetheinyl transferase family protein [Gelidibacter salicanalis]
MIGNDIVDIELAKRNSRWQEQRYLDKLFTTEEQEFIRSGDQQFQNIWRLWTMKESVYKITSRAEGTIRFNPTNFKCTVLDATQGKIIYKNQSIATSTIINQNFVQTTASSNPQWVSKIFQFSSLDYPTQHSESVQQAIKAYAAYKKVVDTSVAVIKNRTGIPQFYIYGQLQTEQLSLTHHGLYGAFAISVIES